jgi:hypothetical protein
MKKLMHWIAATALMMCFSGAQAASNAQGTVSGLFIHTPGVLMFQVGTAISSGPSCASSTKQWAIALTDPMAKSLMALLLSAQAQGKQVLVVSYLDTCRDWGDRVVPSYAMLID